MKHVVSWFEIPVNDLERASRFYSEIFDIILEPFEFSGQAMAVFPAEDEAINGTLIKGEGYVPSSQGTIVYLNAGEDLNLVLNKVEPAGGKVIEEKVEVIEGRVYAAVFQDVEGNRVGLYSTK